MFAAEFTRRDTAGLLFCLAFWASLTGCIPLSPSTPATLPLPIEGHSKLSALPIEKVKLHSSERDAWRFPAGTACLDLDPIPSATLLRISLISTDSGTVQLTMYQEGQVSAIPSVSDDVSWTTRDVPVEPEESVHLVLHSSAPYFVSECQLQGRKPGRPDVIVHLIDTLRKDHLGPYNYPLETSPNVTEFAKDAVLFRQLTPMSSWTRPSVASLLTGTMDYTHHALSPEDHLREGLPSLPKALQSMGWDTHAIVTNPEVGSYVGFGDLFQWQEDLWVDHTAIGATEDIECIDRAVNTILSAAGRPLFLYLHTLAPHREYVPPKEYEHLFMPERFVGTRPQVRVMKEMALYDAEIRFSDDQFGRVIRALKETGRYDDALIVLVADHGEQFMEHGELAHAKSLHEEELGVPLIIKLPGKQHAGREIRQVVQMADIAPTLLDALGVNHPSKMDGRSFMPLIEQTGTYPPSPAFARLRIGKLHQYMAQTDTMKYIHDIITGESFWYDRKEDAAEVHALFQPPPGGAELKAFADEMAARPVPEKGSTSPPLTEEERQQLKALGYL